MKYHFSIECWLAALSKTSAREETDGQEVVLKQDTKKEDDDHDDDPFTISD